MCPVCHVERNPGKPYHVRRLLSFFSLLIVFQAFLDGMSQPLSLRPTDIAALESRGWFSRADSSQFAIISFRLASVDDSGHPPRLVESHLKSYFAFSVDPPGRFHYYDVTFSLEKTVNITEFKRTVANLVSDLDKSVLSSPCPI